MSDERCEWILPDGRRCSRAGVDWADTAEAPFLCRQHLALTPTTEDREG